MDDSTRTLLVQRIENEFKNLDSMEDGEGKQKAINNLVVLYKLKIEEEKIDAEYNEHCDKCDLEKTQQENDIEIKNKDIELKTRQIEVESCNRLQELELRKAQLDEQKLDRWVNLGMQVGLAMLSIVAYDIWNRRGLKFEETGTITSPMTRNLLSKMLPKR